MTSSTKARGLVVVTGASTGIGAAAARQFAARGHHVLAGVRRESDARAVEATNLQPVILDITNSDHIAALVDAVDATGRPLQVLVNNAGIAVNAPVEVLPMTEWRRQFDANLFGHIEVTQALLPALRRNRGRIVNISSIAGRLVQPTYGAYSGSKFALEAVSDALRRELAPDGVEVVVVQPGAVRTELVGRAGETVKKLTATMTDEQERRYGRLLDAVLAQSESFLRDGLEATRAAQVVVTAATAPRPRARYTVGRDAAVLTRLARILPDRLLDPVLAAALRRHLMADN